MLLCVIRSLDRPASPSLHRHPRPLPPQLRQRWGSGRVDSVLGPRTCERPLDRHHRLRSPRRRPHHPPSRPLRRRRPQWVKVYEQRVRERGSGLERWPSRRGVKMLQWW